MTILSILLSFTLCANAQSSGQRAGKQPAQQETKQESPKSYKECPDANHPHMIDLGLPSKTKWACCNVDADKPEDKGGYFSWGETNEKATYNWTTYTLCEGSPSTCQNIGSEISGKQYDVAHVKWGGSWVMPSIDEIKELIDNCFSSFTSMNGVKGQMFLSKNNGVTIFLPATALHYVGEIGQYWSSTQEPSDLKWAYGLYFFPNTLYWDYFSHAVGLTVRPVVSGTNSIHLLESSSDISNQTIYNIYGIKVADNYTNMNTLPSGMYIVNGKKMVIK